MTYVEACRAIAELERERNTWEREAVATLAALVASSADRDEAVRLLGRMVGSVQSRECPLCERDSSDCDARVP